jgi:hypothetical protein
MIFLIHFKSLLPHFLIHINTFEMQILPSILQHLIYSPDMQIIWKRRKAFTHDYMKVLINCLAYYRQSDWEKTKNKRGGAIFQNCQTKWKVSWLLSKFIPKKRVDLVWFYTTFNNTSVISWQSVLFLEETGGRGENHRPVVSHWQTLSHNVVVNPNQINPFFRYKFA